MSEYFIEISKENLEKCVDWTDRNNLRFVTKKDLDKDSSKIAYSEVICDAIKEKYLVDITIKDKHIGLRNISIYLSCRHHSKFTARCSRKELVNKKALRLQISRKSQTPDCNCRKFLNYKF